MQLIERRFQDVLRAAVSYIISLGLGIGGERK